MNVAARINIDEILFDGKCSLSHLLVVKGLVCEIFSAFNLKKIISHWPKVIERGKKQGCDLLLKSPDKEDRRVAAAPSSVDNITE